MEILFDAHKTRHSAECSEMFFTTVSTLREETHPRSVCLLRAEAQLRKKAPFFWMAEVLEYPPGLAPALFAVDRLHVRKLSADGALG